MIDEARKPTITISGLASLTFDFCWHIEPSIGQQVATVPFVHVGGLAKPLTHLDVFNEDSQNVVVKSHNPWQGIGQASEQTCMFAPLLLFGLPTPEGSAKTVIMKLPAGRVAVL